MVPPISRRQLIKIAAATTAAAGLVPVSGRTADAYASGPPSRKWLSLDDGWTFVRADVTGAQGPDFDDSAWQPVNIPHTWNALDGQDGGGDYYRGVGWYRRHYTPPAELAGSKLWLQFAGVGTVADVYLNGVHLGRHAGGYARFRFDASAMTIGADNVIAVRVNNADNPDVPPLSADYTFFGGIYRNVSLFATNLLHVRMLDDAGPGVYIRQPTVTAASATVEVTCLGWNDNGESRAVAVHTTVADGVGKVVSDVTTTVGSVGPAAGFQTVQTLDVPNPHLWQSKDDPYLYRVTVEVHDTAAGTVTDTVTEPLGLRSYAVEADSGFTLNGRALRLHGVNRHQDRLDMGWAIGDAEHLQDFDLMDEMGVNALRTAHYQQDQKVYDLADERGYIVWAEIPLVERITESPAADASAFVANARQQLRELIKQNHNHPSICFWGIGNEQQHNDTATNNLLATLAADATALDSERLTTYAMQGGSTSSLTNHTQLSGFNVYYGWYGGSYNDFGPWAEGLHDDQPTRRIAISEYGAGACIDQHQENPPAPAASGTWHPEEYQSLFHEAHWAQIQTRPYLWGTFVWNMFDFAVDNRHDGDIPGRNDKGLVTYDRLTRKDAFYWYKANWTSTPFVYITSRRWTTRTTADTTIKLYANVDTVALSINGVDAGPAQTSGDHIFTWPVTLDPGDSLIEAVGSSAGQIYTDSVTWNLQ